MAEVKELRELLERLEGKLEYARKLIEEYDEAMDYANHCNLLGFAEGIEFAIEEAREVLTGKGTGKGKKEAARKVTSKGRGAVRQGTRQRKIRG